MDLKTQDYSDIRGVCQEAIDLFERIFLFQSREQLISSYFLNIQKTSAKKSQKRYWVPSRQRGYVVPKVLPKLTCSILGWREVQDTHHYGVCFIPL